MGEGNRIIAEVKSLQAADTTEGAALRVVDARADNTVARPNALVVIWLAANAATPTHVNANFDIVKNAP